jgi:hypothetical protein
MPYVKQRQRDKLLTLGTATCAGDLNFKFTTLAIVYLENHGLSYATINDVLGALEGAKLEFYRRVAIPYENSKIQENGDVYPVAFTEKKSNGSLDG